ncbi:MAG TPA: DUF4988 domain-containing protein [Candidatus Coprenecus stercoravium]|uniref:DUF4988 domain-containing protein n=1 Tax=Candidatus Coprenecus stercoravium TaxID=2840735 RepID=A0A9D2K9E0_9BACT|nr:DUF4988 domain-containing protein [Candidatus Coprenecus stercoravium]
MLLLVSLGSCSKYDDSGIRDYMSEISGRVDSLESRVDSIQSTINTLQALVDRQQGRITVDSVEQLKDSVAIHFSDGKIVSLADGEDGNPASDGTPGSTPAAITVVKGEDGVYYWATVKEGEEPKVIEVDGKKFPTSTEAPKIRINEESGYWEVYSNGEWKTTNVSAEDAGATYITKIEEKETTIDVTLAGDVPLTFEKTIELSLQFLSKEEEGEAITAAYFPSEAGETQGIKYKVTPANAQITLTKPEGWKAVLNEETGEIDITSPSSNNTYAEKYGKVSALLTLEDGSSAIASLDVYIGNPPSSEVFVGDYLYSDGTWSTDLYEGKEVIGIVFWAGNLGAEDAELAKDHPDAVNGLAVSLEYAFNPVNWLPNTISIADWIETSDVSGIENSLQGGTDKDTEPSNFYALGYANTKIMRAFFEEYAGFTLLDYLTRFEKENPAPEKTSGWFIPSVQEFSRLCFGSSTAYTNLVGKECTVVTTVNEKLEALGYTPFNLETDRLWLSMECDESRAYVGYFNNNGDAVEDEITGELLGFANTSRAFKSTTIAAQMSYVRPVIAF